MLQRNRWKVYWKIFVLVALVSAVIFFSKPAPVSADGCSACDIQRANCDGTCGGDQTCIDQCYADQQNCIGLCLQYLEDYHFDDFDPTVEQEINLCKRMGHRAGYNRCMAGNPLYPDDFNACIAGASADDCCYAQEWRYDWENCW